MATNDEFILAFRRLQGEMDRWFVDLSAGSRLPRASSVRALADAYLTHDPPTLTIQLDVAGVDPAEVEIQLDGEMLVVRGVRRRHTAERRIYQHAEIDWGPFERRVRLGVWIDPDAASATYERGLLTIVLPLGGRATAERIGITVRGAGTAP